METLTWLVIVPHTKNNQEIDKQMRQYAICSEDLNDIQEQLNNMEDDDDSYDLIASNVQNI